jgi:protein-disulfide isomerase
MDNIEPILAAYEKKTNSTSKSKIPKFSVDAWLIAVATLVGAILVCLTILWVNAGSPSLFKFAQNNSPKVSGSPQAIDSSKLVDDDAVLGSVNAPVTIVEFSDFQCLFCRKFWVETMPQLKKTYIDTGKVKFVYRDFPLSSIHPSAEASAEASECAADQNKYWEMHDIIFSEQAKKGTGTIQYTVNDLKKWAGQIGLDTTKFNSCLDSGKYKSEVEKDTQDAAAIGISGTPAFVIGSKIISGAYPFSEFQKAIDAELAK